ncbi:L-threonylcarbamoyladenylate synthase [Vibrio porteresiae]|uniref:Threonylcarbamoyl-AMP synthase n=1 Tax=Vibrio porteresiae DSM 19223 TaxID=1123496 RepID=A0ABZ0QJE0_9VIBR|nr:L-threonylcarbamoyladenylate synthase [Vibrio porteresiae]WPC76616.1 L-threonylcarbamoyladenylate synthase [Vibrio porteresiae DSM 19223]
MRWSINDYDWFDYYGDDLLNTLRLNANKAQDLQHAACLLEQGKLVALPTETVYGLAADATQPEAVKGIFAAKGRPANHPLIVHIGDMSQLSDWAADIPDQAIALAKAFWPGPLTLLLPKGAQASSVVTGGLDTIAIRMPAHPVILSILKEYKLAVAAPSANPYKQLSPTNAEQVISGLDGKIDAVLDGGDCLFGLESTIVDLTSENVRVLRAGPITAQELSQVLEQPVDYPKHHNMAVPGNVGSHYQPKTVLRLVDNIEHAVFNRDKNSTYAVIHTSELVDDNGIASFKMPLDAASYGKKLYRSLAEADKLQLDEIWLERPPQGEAWNAVNDRLSRAALPL